MGIMSSMGDFFGNAKRRLGEIGDAASEKVSGLRGTAQPAAAPATPAGTSEAQAFRASGAGNPAHPGFIDNTPKPLTGLRNVAAKAGRLAGPGAALVEGYDAAQNIAAGENPIASVGRAALRGGATMLGGATGAVLGTAVAPGVGTLGGGVAGGVAGYKLGDAAADSLFGPAKVATQPVPAAVAAPATNGQPPISGGGSLAAAPVAPQDPGLVDLVGGDKARPAVLTDSNVGVPVSGQGAFRRSGGQAIKLGGTASVASAPPAQAPTTPAQPGLREVPVLTRNSGWTETKNARLQAQGREQDIQDSGNKATLAATTAQRDLELKKWIYDKEHAAGNEQELRVAKRNEEYASGKVPTAEDGLLDRTAIANREGKVKAYTSDLSERIKHTQSLTGKNVGQLSDPQHSLLLKANDMREQLDVYRKSAPSFVQDFFGNKRFDSKNLYSYLPARDAKGAVKPAIPELFGYSVEMGNGNKVKVYSMVNKDGSTGFNFTGPNAPADADAMEIMKPAIVAAQAGRK